MFNRQSVTPSPKRSPGPRTPASGRSRRPGAPTPATSAEREQAMRDYKLGIEYKHLKQHCPGGVYLLPSFDDLRLFHGAIFVRRGAFSNAIFKFTLRCPPTYNDAGTHPTVTFSSYIYNPHVHQETGEVDLSIAYPQWDPSKHFLVTVLTYVKRIFYVKDYEELTEEQKGRLPNQEAYRMFQEDPDGYRRRVQECVNESQRSVYLNEPGSTIKFKEESGEHEALRRMMKQHFGVEGDGEDDDGSGVVTREDTLEIIQRVASMGVAGSPKK